MEQKTHWKKLTNPDYIGAYSLMETGTAQDLTVTIASVGREIVKGTDGKKEECTVAKLVGQKPFIINRTNAKTISSIYGTPFIEDWACKKITLYVAKVKVGGETVEALRIRPVKPALPELTPTHERWEGARTAIKSGNTTIEQVRTHFVISPENEQLLLQ
jgi:hypothetical protein